MKKWIAALVVVAASAPAQSPPVARLITGAGGDDATIAGAAGAVAPNADVPRRR